MYSWSNGTNRSLFLSSNALDWTRLTIVWTTLSYQSGLAGCASLNHSCDKESISWCWLNPHHPIKMPLRDNRGISQVLDSRGLPFCGIIVGMSQSRLILCSITYIKLGYAAISRANPGYALWGRVDKEVIFVIIIR